ncbi:MAG: hypothetical protein PHF86_14125 [Candidatus Nanoarchaeia archaeon]|jgi:hypothetical protein|nr:hypothetical protein [Candidatus Nanoarchaeia archaeon]
MNKRIRMKKQKQNNKLISNIWEVFMKVYDIQMKVYDIILAHRELKIDKKLIENGIPINYNKNIPEFNDYINWIEELVYKYGVEIDIMAWNKIKECLIDIKGKSNGKDN